jgi:hypothetical protein
MVQLSKSLYKVCGARVVRERSVTAKLPLLPHRIHNSNTKFEGFPPVCPVNVLSCPRNLFGCLDQKQDANAVSESTLDRIAHLTVQTIAIRDVVAMLMAVEAKKSSQGPEAAFQVFSSWTEQSPRSDARPIWGLTR